MGQALYRKYRSKSLQEIVGQEHITSTLNQALKQGRISHAYLFTGPRGVGKTSIARILAHAINNLEYADDSSHIDIIEIDAASNRRIDEIRDLRDKVYVAPVSAKYKVYIIDEVHMLTREAFNALLKTLEEPPAHVVFILATTDAHKVPETIISRTQRFTFKPVPHDQVISHLRDIAKREKLQVTDEALTLLAEHGEGSFRDSISLLDQAAARGSKLGAEEVRTLLGIAPVASLEGLLQLLRTNAEPAAVMQTLSDLSDQGYQAAAVAKQLGHRVRAHLSAVPEEWPLDWSLQLLKRLLEVPAAAEPQRLLEIILLEQLTAAEPASKPAAVAKLPAPAPPTKQAAPATPEKSNSAAIKPPSLGSAAAPADPEVWRQVLEALKRQHNTLYGVVRMAEPKFIDKNNLELHFAFAFHQKRISEAANRQLIIAILKQITGRAITINCYHTKTAKAPSLAAPIASKSPTTTIHKPLEDITNIFGGGEVVES